MQLFLFCFRWWAIWSYCWWPTQYHQIHLEPSCFPISDLQIHMAMGGCWLFSSFDTLIWWWLILRRWAIHSFFWHKLLMEMLNFLSSLWNCLYHPINMSTKMNPRFCWCHSYRWLGLQARLMFVIEVTCSPCHNIVRLLSFPCIISC